MFSVSVIRYYYYYYAFRDYKNELAGLIHVARDIDTNQPVMNKCMTTISIL